MTRLIDVLTFYLFVCITSGTLYDIFAPCCHEGVKWTAASYRCDNYPAPVLNISDSDQAGCLSIIEVCCIKQTQLNTCEEGKKTALDSMVCAIRDADPGAEQFRECCHCCRLGLESRGAEPACESPGLGEPCDTKYRECCKGEITEVANFTGGGGIVKRHSGSDISEDIDTGDTGEKHDRNYNLTTEGSDSNGSTDQTTSSLAADRVDTTATTVEEFENISLSCRHGNVCQHRCIERSQGGIECRCYQGYRLQSDAKSCQDIDECEEGLARCALGQQCVNTQGRFTCLTSRCLPGYEINPLTGRCQYMEQGCDPGFAYNSVSSRCEDLNECGLGTDSCGTGERCENTIGSYRCRRVRHCGTGYTLDATSQRCMDNNECLLGTHNCAGGYVCQNIQGSFRCAPKDCDIGFKFDHVKGECDAVHCPRGMAADGEGVCKDIDECVDFGRTACRRHQRCVNTKGSFYCRNTVNCPAGYEVSAESGCQDIDECSKDTHRCGPGQQCINRQGSYFCQCPRGMRHDDVSGCVDVDECSYGAAICPPNSKCVNTPGSFKCDCVDGLMADGNDACTDIDECSHDGICQQSCVNVLGTFFCSCHRGYQLRDDKRSCEDIDECTQFGGRRGKSGVCGGTCVNLPGSYRCACSEGWRLKPNGRSCDDIDECKEGIAYCPHPESLCINTKGGYKCPVVTCPNGFLKSNSSAQQNSVRCKRISVNCEECRKGLIFRSFNFLSFPPKVRIPSPLFSMTGSRLIDKYYTWSIELISARPLRAGVLPAKKTDFALEKSSTFVRVTLMKQIEGPQDVVLKVIMTTTSYFKGFESKSESQIYLYVTDDD